MQRGPAKRVVEPDPVPIASPSRVAPSVVLAGVVLVVALAISAGALATVLLLQSGGESQVAATPPATSSGGQPAQTGEPEPPESTERTSGRPGSSDVERVIRAYYAAVLDREFDRAWGMLSPSYRRWKLGYDGRGAWLRMENETADRLMLGSPSATIMSYDPATAIATIRVDGMTYATDSGVCAYEGVTWVRRFDGRWRYDPGYLQRSGREATWKPRRSETLGYACLST